MYRTGDFVVCGNNGICEVKAITTMDVEGIDPDRKYYQLQATTGGKSVIFLPVDQNKVVIRPIISKKEAEELLAHIPEIEEIEIPVEKKREECYKDAMRQYDCESWVQILKTLHSRKIERVESGKKLTTTDERYEHKAEENLYGELALALGVSVSDAEIFVTEKFDI